jgi:hypothetical protein
MKVFGQFYFKEVTVAVGVVRSIERMKCVCGKMPIFKRGAGGPDLRPEYKFECICGEFGIAGSNKQEATYRWRRRAQIREAYAWLRGRPEAGVPA